MTRWIGIPRGARRLGMAGALAAGLAVMTAAADELRLNEIQVIGTHNSYHIAPARAILDIVASAGRARAEGLDFSHPPLADQFSRLGIRQIELDLFADPKGGHFVSPNLRRMVKNQGKDPGPDPAADGKLKQPGLKVLHIQDVDFRSHAPTFIEALKQVRAWSQANPRHVPILIMVELKDESHFGLPTRPVKFGRDEVEQVDAEVLSVFDRSQILTPDQVRGRFETLPEAIRTEGWPKIDQVRGLVMFALENENAARKLYLEGHKALEGRLMFASVDPKDPAAAWFNISDPIKNFDRIQKLVREGFLVRTRADVDTVQARSHDTTMRDKALASGAQFISTDYPEPDPRLTPYRVHLPGGVVARPNPVSSQEKTEE